MELLRREPSIGGLPTFIGNGGWEDERNVFHVSFDSEQEAVSTVIIESVAAIQNRDIEELDPLFDAVDPDALDNLTTPQTTSEGIDEIRFDYAGMEIRVDPAGDVWMRWK